MDEQRIYYVYEWYNEETGEIFYVGKGHGDRCRQKSKTKRNRFFYNYTKKYKCNYRIIYDCLTEEDALKKEHETIIEYRKLGFRLTNFDDGGHVGGACPGELNPMYGKTHTEEAREKIRQANLNGKNAKENNTQWKVSPKDRMSPEVYEKWRAKQKARKFGSSNPNSHKVILYKEDRSFFKEFGNIKQCCEWLIENENLDTNIENLRSKIKYYNKNGRRILQKYYVKVIKPIKHGNTVPSLGNKEGVTTIESITNEKNIREEASRVEEM